MACYSQLPDAILWPVAELEQSVEQPHEQVGLDPRVIAEGDCWVYKQHTTTWAHELTLRPFKKLLGL